MNHRSFRCALMLAGIVVTAAVRPDPVRADAQVDAAKAATEARLKRISAELFSGAATSDAAIRELKQILAIDPRAADAHLLLGIAYRAQGSQEFTGEAVAEFRQALALNPGLVPARVYLAQAYGDLGRQDRARQELEAALLQMPGNPQVMALLGNVERQLKNPRRAMELIGQALAADPSFAQARYYLGLALLDLGQRDDAIRELERVRQSGAKVADVYLALGSAYSEAGRFEEAADVLSQATQIDSVRPDVRIQLARAYRSTGKLDQAEQQLKYAAPERATTLLAAQYVEFDLHLEWGLLRLQQGQHEAAVVAFKKALDLDPDHGPANRGVAEVYLAQGLYALSSRHASLAEKLGFPLPEAKRALLKEKLRGKGAT